MQRSNIQVPTRIHLPAKVFSFIHVKRQKTFSRFHQIFVQSQQVSYIAAQLNPCLPSILAFHLSSKINKTYVLAPIYLTFHPLFFCLLTSPTLAVPRMKREKKVLTQLDFATLCSYKFNCFPTFFWLPFAWVVFYSEVFCQSQTGWNRYTPHNACTQSWAASKAANASLDRFFFVNREKFFLL